MSCPWTRNDGPSRNSANSPASAAGSRAGERCIRTKCFKVSMLNQGDGEGRTVPAERPKAAPAESETHVNALPPKVVHEAGAKSAERGHHAAKAGRHAAPKWPDRVFLGRTGTRMPSACRTMPPPARQPGRTAPRSRPFSVAAVPSRCRGSPPVHPAPIAGRRTCRPASRRRHHRPRRGPHLPDGAGHYWLCPPPGELTQQSVRGRGGAALKQDWHGASR